MERLQGNTKTKKNKTYFIVVNQTAPKDLRKHVSRVKSKWCMSLNLYNGVLNYVHMFSCVYKRMRNLKSVCHKPSYMEQMLK